MAAMSDYLEQALADHVFRTATYTKETALWIALYTTATNDTTGGTEVTGGSYARRQLDPGDANWDRTGSEVSNATPVTFPQATASWGTVSHAAVMTLAAGGNRIAHGALDAGVPIGNGDTFEFAANALKVTFD